MKIYIVTECESLEDGSSYMSIVAAFIERKNAAAWIQGKDAGAYIDWNISEQEVIDASKSL